MFNVLFHGERIAIIQENSNYRLNNFNKKLFILLSELYLNLSFICEFFVIHPSNPPPSLNDTPPGPQASYRDEQIRPLLQHCCPTLQHAHVSVWEPYLHSESGEEQGQEES